MRVKLDESGKLCTEYEKRNKTIRVWNDGVIKPVIDIISGLYLYKSNSNQYSTLNDLNFYC